MEKIFKRFAVTKTTVEHSREIAEILAENESDAIERAVFHGRNCGGYDGDRKITGVIENTEVKEL